MIPAQTRVLWATILGSSMAFADGSIVTVAIPKLPIAVAAIAILVFGVADLPTVADRANAAARVAGLIAVASLGVLASPIFSGGAREAALAGFSTLTIVCAIAAALSAAIAFFTLRDEQLRERRLALCRVTRQSCLNPDDAGGNDAKRDCGDWAVGGVSRRDVGFGRKCPNACRRHQRLPWRYAAADRQRHRRASLQEPPCGIAAG